MCVYNVALNYKLWHIKRWHIYKLTLKCFFVFFILDLKSRLEVKKVKFVISDKLDQGKVLIHLLPPGWVQQRDRAKVEDTLGRGVDGTTGHLMIWGGWGEDGFQNTLFQTRMNRKHLDVARLPSNRTASCDMILLFTMCTTHRTPVTVRSACWLLCTFYCDSV